MATEKRKPNPKFTSPKGTFKYPRLNEPDYGNEKFPKPNGEFSVQLILPAAEAQALAAKLKPIHDEAAAEGEQKFAELPIATRKKLKGLAVNPLYTEVFDDETEEPTGDVVFKFKMQASGENKKTKKKWSRKPVIFDAKGQPMTNPPSIWGGTVGKVSFEASPYWVAGQGTCGLSLRLQAVQVIDLVSGGGSRNATDYGFGEEEGYAHEDKPVNEEGFGDESGGTTTPSDGSEDF